MKILILIFALISVTLAVTLNCKFVMGYGTNLPLTYGCYQSTLSNINETETLTAVYGTHMSGKSNADVGYLFIDSVASLTFFPRGIINFFANLIAIYINRCNISTLRGFELNVFIKLRWFGFQNQPLERIPGNLFANKPLVHFASFQSNNIKHVSYDLLSSFSTAYIRKFGSQLLCQSTCNNC